MSLLCCLPVLVSTDSGCISTSRHSTHSNGDTTAEDQESSHSSGDMIVEGQEMEATHSNSDTTTAACGEFSVDKLGQQRYRTLCTGPGYVYIQCAKFHSSTCQIHANDMLPQLKAVVEEGRTAVVIIVDGGPDWSPGSLLNNLFFFCLWRDAGLDILVVCSYAARFSAYNPIEHLWSPSKKLCGVQFSSKASGDTKPPSQMSGLTTEE